MQALRESLHLVPDDQQASFWRDRMAPETALGPIPASAEFRRLADQYAGSKAPE